MGVPFQPSKQSGSQQVAEIIPYTPGTDQTFLKGAVVTLDVATQDLDEHAGGATVTGVLGVAAEGVDSGDADNPSGDVEVAKANRDTHFVGQCISGGSIVTDLAGSSITPGDQYGVLKHTDNIWYVDVADTTNVVVEITKVDDDLDLVWFKFIESALQQP